MLRAGVPAGPPKVPMIPAGVRSGRGAGSKWHTRCVAQARSAAGHGVRLVLLVAEFRLITLRCSLISLSRDFTWVVAPLPFNQGKKSMRNLSLRGRILARYPYDGPACDSFPISKPRGDHRGVWRQSLLPSGRHNVSPVPTNHEGSLMHFPYRLAASVCLPVASRAPRKPCVPLYLVRIRKAGRRAD